MTLDELERLYALRRLDLVSAIDVVRWASEHVASNDDLVALASLYPSASSADVDFVVEEAIVASGRAILSDESAARLVATYVARLIVDGSVDPIDGARNLWGLARRVPGIESELRAFIGMASEWEDSPQHRNEYDLDIIKSAGVFIAAKQQNCDADRDE